MIIRILRNFFRIVYKSGTNALLAIKQLKYFDVGYLFYMDMCQVR